MNSSTNSLENLELLANVAVATMRDHPIKRIVIDDQEGEEGDQQQQEQQQHEEDRQQQQQQVESTIQVEAERKKRAAILESEGRRDAAIKVAKGGQKRAQNLASEAEQRERINLADRGQVKARQKALNAIAEALKKDHNIVIDEDEPDSSSSNSTHPHFNPPPSDKSDKDSWVLDEHPDCQIVAEIRHGQAEDDVKYLMKWRCLTDDRWNLAGIVDNPGNGNCSLEEGAMVKKEYPKLLRRFHAKNKKGRHTLYTIDAIMDKRLAPPAPRKSGELLQDVEYLVRWSMRGPQQWIKARKLLDTERIGGVEAAGVREMIDEFEEKQKLEAEKKRKRNIGMRGMKMEAEGGKRMTKKTTNDRIGIAQRLRKQQQHRIGFRSGTLLGLNHGKMKKQQKKMKKRH